MSTMTELCDRGIRKMRLPMWNEHAFAVPRPEGPWADIYDVGAGIGSGDPVPVLIAVCDEDTRWKPAEPEGGSP
jgi:hypothetical protein